MANTYSESDAERVIILKTLDAGVTWVPDETGGGGGGGVTDHGLLDGLADDDHSQYPLLAGRVSGQTLYGGTASGDDLTVRSTAHATKGTIFFGGGGINVFDEVNSRWGVGTATPLFPISVVTTPTLTTGEQNNISSSISPNPLASSSATFRGGDMAMTIPDTNTQAFTGTVAGMRSYASHFGSGNATSMYGLQLQSFLGYFFGTPIYSSTATTYIGAVFQIGARSTTLGTAAVDAHGVVADARHAGPGVITRLSGGHFAFGVSNGGAGAGTVETAYAIRASRRNQATANLLTAGTITNPYMVFVDGFPTGPTYTNTPTQLNLESSDVATIGVRQLGTNSHNRFQGKALFGADSAPTLDLGFGGAVARTIGVERQPTAATAGSLFTVQGGAAALASTNLAGGTIHVQSGAGTGSSTPSRVDIQAPRSGTASGTTDQTLVSRVGINGTGALVSGVAKVLLTIPLAAGEMAGGLLVFGIEVSNGIDHIQYESSVYYVVVNKAGVYTTNSVLLLGAEAKSDPTDTIAPVVSFANGVNQTTFRIASTVTGMASITTHRITYTFLSNAQQDVAF